MQRTNGRPAGDGHVAIADVCNLESIFRNKLLVGGVFLAGALATLIFLFVRSRAFESDSRLFVRETVTIDPTAAAADTMVKVTESQQREIQSSLDLLSSRGLLETIVDRLGPEYILAYEEPSRVDENGDPTAEKRFTLPDIGGAVTAIKTALAPFNLADLPNPRAKAIEQLSKSIEVSSEDKSNVVSIAVQGESPYQAQKTCETLLDVFAEMHLDAHRVPGALEFFETQTAHVKAELDEKTAELRDLKNGCAITSVEDSRRVLADKLREVELAILTASAGQFSSQAKIDGMVTMLDRVPETIIAEEVSGLTNTARDVMRGQLYNVEIKNADLTSYSENHPEVVRRKRQLEEAKTVFGGEDVQPQVKRAVNVSHQQLDLARMLEQAEADAMKARTKRLLEQRESISREVRQLNEREVAIRDLERSVALLDTKYRRYMTSQENARIDLQAKQLSSVNVVQTPSFNDDPVDLSNSLLFLAGMLGSLMAAVAAAIGLEFLRNDISNARDVERELGMPVLATIPAGRRQRIVLN